MHRLSEKLASGSLTNIMGMAVRVPGFSEGLFRTAPEHLKFALSLFRWLRRRLVSSACIGDDYIAYFSVLAGLVLAGAEIVKLQS